MVLISRQQGFTLVELLIALSVGLFFAGIVLCFYDARQKEYRHFQADLQVQQNLRSAVIVLEQEIRMAGYDPTESGRFGIADIRRYDTVGTGADPDGQPSLFFRSDIANENGQIDSNEEIAFRIQSKPRTDRKLLTVSYGNGGRQILAENIEAIGFAYAVDANHDGSPDTWRGGNNLIWAVDSDNDNLLDTHLDANDDGRIDLDDDTDSDGRITPADGGTIDPPISPGDIKMVRVWLLGQSPPIVRNHVDTQRRLVGDLIFPAAGTGIIRRVCESIVENRNL